MWSICIVYRDPTIGCETRWLIFLYSSAFPLDTTDKICLQTYKDFFHGFCTMIFFYLCLIHLHTVNVICILSYQTIPTGFFITVFVNKFPLFIISLV